MSALHLSVLEDKKTMFLMLKIGCIYRVCHKPSDGTFEINLKVLKTSGPKYLVFRFFQESFQDNFNFK